MEQILEKLVEFPTVSSNREANNAALAYIHGYLAERGMHVQSFAYEGYGSLVATTQPDTKRPTVMLAAHLDVVPPSNGATFELHEDNENFYGRGVLDMKFAIAAYLQIAQELRYELPHYNFGIELTTDEEIAGHHGTAKLVEAGYLPEVCILPDGGDNWQMQTSSKGFSHIKLITHGTAAHSRNPANGVNAIEKLQEVTDDIRALFPSTDAEIDNTFSLNEFHGGKAPNQVPEHAEAVIDTRFVSNQEQTRLLSEIGRVCTDRAELVVLGESPTINFKLDDPYLAPFVQLITEVTGTEVHGSCTLGTSDVRFFAEHGVPCISVYPTGGEHHGDGEWISKRALQQFKEIVRRYLEQMAKT